MNKCTLGMKCAARGIHITYQQIQATTTFARKYENKSNIQNTMDI